MSPGVRHEPIRRGRIVIIDDEAALTRTLARGLDRICDVTVFNEPLAAFEALVAGGTFDVILCDVMMPVQTGTQLYERLRAVRPDLAERMVFMTGGVLDGETRAFLAGLANTKIDKPMGIHELRTLMQTLIDERRRLELASLA